MISFQYLTGKEKNSHNFTKFFSGTRVNQIVNNCLIFAICYLWVREKLLLNRKWTMLEIVDKNVFKITTMSNNFVFICRF